MKLADAKLCCSCECVCSDADHAQCPDCADPHSISLSRALNHGKQSLKQLHAKWRKSGKGA